MRFYVQVQVWDGGCGMRAGVSDGFVGLSCRPGGWSNRMGSCDEEWIKMGEVGAVGIKAVSQRRFYFVKKM